jgi:hypothetical protein
MPSPIADFIRRDSDGKHVDRWEDSLVWSWRSSGPSVMYPVRSGIGWVMSSLGMVRMGNWVMEPFDDHHVQHVRKLWTNRCTCNQGNHGVQGLLHGGRHLTKASAYEDISVRMTNTCKSLLGQDYSAVVRARRGVIIAQSWGHWM